MLPPDNLLSWPAVAQQWVSAAVPVSSGPGAEEDQAITMYSSSLFDFSENNATVHIAY
jgi:hypothetical protein